MQHLQQASVVLSTCHAPYQLHNHHQALAACQCCNKDARQSHHSGNLYASTWQHACNAQLHTFWRSHAVHCCRFNPFLCIYHRRVNAHTENLGCGQHQQQLQTAATNIQPMQQPQHSAAMPACMQTHHAAPCGCGPGIHHYFYNVQHVKMNRVHSTWSTCIFNSPHPCTR